MNREVVAYHEAGHVVIAWKLHLLRNAGPSLPRRTTQNHPTTRPCNKTTDALSVGPAFLVP
jgi:hypothetical protein